MEWIRVLFHSSASRKPVFTVQSSSVIQSCPTLWSHGLQHARLPCPSPTAGAYSNSCPLSQWCHPTILSSVVPFSFCLQSFPSIRMFSNESVLRIRWPKYWSFSFSISPSNEYSGLISFRMDWLISLLSKGLSRVLSNTTVQKHQFFVAQLYFPTLTSIHDFVAQLSSQSNSHIHTWLLEKS